MKENKTEKLFLALSEADADLLREAEQTDTRDKLLAKDAAGTLPDDGKIYRRKILKTVLATAACMTLVLGILLITPLFRKESRALPDWITEAGTEGKITRFDEVNYYGAKYLLMESAGIVPTSAGEGDALMFAAAPLSRFLAAGADGTEAVTEALIDRYDIDPDYEYEIKRIVAFRIVLEDPNGFLALRLGTGPIEVIVTENNLEDMITFRSGNRYFSCMINGSLHDNGSERYEFTTSKYIEGFQIVKNFGQDNYAFTVHMSGGRVTELNCRVWNAADVLNYVPADTARVIPDSDVIRSVRGSFTVSDLDEYFRNEPPVTVPPTDTEAETEAETRGEPDPSVPVFPMPEGTDLAVRRDPVRLHPGVRSEQERDRLLKIC